MKRLVVNADDLGADEARNDGIFEAIAAGVVTAASILANGPAFYDAVRRAPDAGARRAAAGGARRASFGVHLNLSEGRPLAGGLRAIVGAGGLFLGKREARRRFAAPDPEIAREAALEIEAQIAALRAAGVDVRHLDGHQHVHLLPAIAEAAREAARRAGIPWVRHEPGVHFRGFPLRTALTVERLEEVVRGLEDGLTELMTHPGRVPPPGAPRGPFSAYSTPERARELEALLDPRFRRALDEAGVELVSFAEAPRP